VFERFVHFFIEALKHYIIEAFYIKGRKEKRKEIGIVKRRRLPRIKVLLNSPSKKQHISLLEVAI